MYHLTSPLVQWDAGTAPVQPAFRVNVTYNTGGDRGSTGSFHLDTSVMYKASVGGDGTIRWRNCTLTEALIRYPVEVSNNTLRLMPMPSDTNRTVQKILRNVESVFSSVRGPISGKVRV